MEIANRFNFISQLGTSRHLNEKDRCFHIFVFKCLMSLNSVQKKWLIIYNFLLNKLLKFPSNPEILLKIIIYLLKMGKILTYSITRNNNQVVNIFLALRSMVSVIKRQM